MLTCGGSYRGGSEKVGGGYKKAGKIRGRKMPALAFQGLNVCSHCQGKSDSPSIGTGVTVTPPRFKNSTRMMLFEP